MALFRAFLFVNLVLYATADHAQDVHRRRHCAEKFGQSDCSTCPHAGEGPWPGPLRKDGRPEEYHTMKKREFDVGVEKAERKKREIARGAGDEAKEQKQPRICTTWQTACSRWDLAPQCRKGAEQPISDTFTCAPDEDRPCQFTADRSLTVDWGTLTPDWKIGSDYMLISGFHKVTYDYDEVRRRNSGIWFTETSAVYLPSGWPEPIKWVDSATRSFNETFELKPGTTGYAAFTPCLICLDGWWTGSGESCFENTHDGTACGPNASLDGSVRVVEVPNYGANPPFLPPPGDDKPPVTFAGVMTQGL